MRCLLVGALVLVSLCGDARAWVDEGHKSVCKIAFGLAPADTRAADRKLIRSDTEFDTFTDSCVFPDHPRVRAPGHGSDQDEILRHARIVVRPADGNVSFSQDFLDANEPLVKEQLQRADARLARLLDTAFEN
jgi:hypothetical protein